MRLSKAIKEGLKVPGLGRGKFKIFHRTDLGQYQACSMGMALVGALGIDEIVRVYDTGEELYSLFDYAFPNTPTCLLDMMQSLNDTGDASPAKIANKLEDMGY
jgi:hypothetical protein